MRYSLRRTGDLVDWTNLKHRPLAFTVAEKGAEFRGVGVVGQEHQEELSELERAGELIVYLQVGNNECTVKVSIRRKYEPEIRSPGIS